MNAIVIPDELRRALDRAFPDERAEAVIERLLRAELARVAAASKATGPHPRTREILASVDAIRAMSRPLANDEISKIRREGRP